MQPLRWRLLLQLFCEPMRVMHRYECVRCTEDYSASSHSHIVFWWAHKICNPSSGASGGGLIAVPIIVVILLLLVVVFRESLITLLKTMEIIKREIESKYHLANKVKIVLVFSQVRTNKFKYNFNLFGFSRITLWNVDYFSFPRRVSYPIPESFQEVTTCYRVNSRFYLN